MDAGALAAFALLVASTASAQPTAEPQAPDGIRGIQRRAPEPPPSAWDAVGLRGFEVQAFGGVAYGGGDSPLQAPNVYGSAFQTVNPAGTILNPAGGKTIGQSFSPYTYDPLGFAFQAGFRPLPAWSFGLFFSYANYGNNADPDTGDLPDGTGGLERVRWSLGAYARYYLTTLSSRLQPWAQVGIGYVDDSASYSHPLGFGVTNGGGFDNGNYLLDYHGLAIPISVGLDWRLAPVFAVGPFFTYEQAIPVGGCLQITVDQSRSGVGPVNTCDGGVAQAQTYGSILGGLFAKLTFDPLPRR